MPYCPKCRDEFQDWVKVCPDCGVDLVDRLPPEPQRLIYNAEELVTIATFSHVAEAYLSKAKLESEGIRSFVADDNVVTMNWLYCAAVGGVKLKVRESDAIEAIRILQLNQDMAPELTVEEGEGCPRCKSLDVHYEMFNLYLIFLVWVLTYFASTGSHYGGGFTFPFLKRKWKCNKCGYQWKM